MFFFRLNNLFWKLNFGKFLFNYNKLLNCLTAMPLFFLLVTALFYFNINKKKWKLLNWPTDTITQVTLNSIYSLWKKGVFVCFWLNVIFVISLLSFSLNCFRYRCCCCCCCFIWKFFDLSPFNPILLLCMQFNAFFYCWFCWFLLIFLWSICRMSVLWLKFKSTKKIYFGHFFDIWQIVDSQPAACLRFYHL